MLITEKNDSVDVCAALFIHLSSNGLKVSEINNLMSDVLTIVQDGGDFTQSLLNSLLVEKGWSDNIIDEYTMQLMMSFLETEFQFKVTTKSLH